MKDKKDFWRKFAGKGYYIALILCAVAIGISGYLYYRNADENAAQKDPAVNVGGQNDPDVDTIVSQPTNPTAPNPTAPSQSATLKTGLPVSGETLMDYAMDCLSYNETTRDWRVHNGIDIAAEGGTAVCAAAEGVVYTTYEDEALGMTVVIRHDGGYVTMYSSLAKELEVKPGDTVALGQTIGYVDNTALLETAIGDHVHFCVTLNDKSIDPQEFFDLS